MKLPALAIATAFAFGIACGLNSEIAHRSRSHAFIAFLLCSAATSLLIGIVFAVRSRVVIAGLGSLCCAGGCSAWLEFALRNNRDERIIF
jgi:hypothetical protein